ncbi:hypothetical protein RUM43_010804 [Polyplax serrata]|uniref:Uncharacterized protein n=1 Tax=Polyplax serrata TaxID=468196 RepID=A0AAN8P404_POLSC
MLASRGLQKEYDMWRMKRNISSFAYVPGKIQMQAGEQSETDPPEVGEGSPGCGTDSMQFPSLVIADDEDT